MTIQEKLKFPWAAIDARSVSGPRRVRGFSPPLFCKTKINETKNNLTKITEPKTAPPPLKNLLRGPCVYGTGKSFSKRFETSARLLLTSKVI